jgi:hypothetical protein
MKSLDLSGKPWDAAGAEIPNEIYLPKGMLGPEERRCLFWIARDHFINRGAIVDAGAFVGASAYCFASFEDYVVKSLSADFRTKRQLKSVFDSAHIRAQPSTCGRAFLIPRFSQDVGLFWNFEDQAPILKSQNTSRPTGSP